jgi:transglutaminase superfamily protein/coenzyme PQQ synthesis protein D (PqqD)
VSSSQEYDVIVNIQTRAVLATVAASEYALPPDVILVTVRDGSARLLDMSGGFHAVPAVGAQMLQETLANGAAAAAAQVAEDYGVAPRQVQDDLAVFLRELEKQGLLCSPRSRQRGGALGPARLLIRPALAAAHRLLRCPEKQARALLGLARLSFALFGWTATIAVWQEAHAHLPARQSTACDAELVQALDRTVRAAVAGHPFAVACKERALCSWSLARTAGLRATLIVGIELFPIAGHCWCEVSERPLGDDQGRCDQFTPVARW